MLSWDRSALTSTGLKIDGDLAVIDVDVSEAALVDALAGALDQRFPELFAHGLVRHAGGVKEAWIARVDEPFRAARLAALVSRQRPGRSRGAEASGRVLRLARDAAVRDRRAACPRPPGRGDQHLPVRRRRLAGNRAAGVAAGAAESGLRAGVRPVRRHRRGGGAHRRQGRRARPRRGNAHVLRTRRRHRGRDARLRHDDGRRAGAPPARARGARQCAGNAALLGHLPRSDPGADGQPPHQLGPLRPRHLRHHDGNDLAPARARRRPRGCSSFWGNCEKEDGAMDESSTATRSAEPTGNSWRALASTRSSGIRCTGRRARRGPTSGRSTRKTRFRPRRGSSSSKTSSPGCWQTTRIAKAPS